MSQNNPFLDKCGCCEGVDPMTPADLRNRPGLDAISYRVATHARFKTTMLASISHAAFSGGLTTREDNDPSIAILDAAATMLDVLTFYQERIANEGYLRTATERRSVLDLAEAIGYRLNPGVAASTYLAFEIEGAAGAPGLATIEAGTKVQSLPGQDERPQIFETSETLLARAEWNALKPRLVEPRPPRVGHRHLYLNGTATGLVPGDGLLIVGAERETDRESERWDFRIVRTVEPDTTAEHTLVTWEKGLGWRRFGREIRPASEDLQVYALRRRAALFGYNAPDWRGMADQVRERYDPGRTNPHAAEWPGLTLSGITSVASPAGATTGTGLYGEYYDSRSFTVRELRRLDSTVDFDWGTDSPSPLLGPDTFSVRWTGQVQPEYSESYTFKTRSDDGVRLWVNGQKLIDNWTDHGATDDSGTIQLQAGLKYDIRLEYYENGGVALIRLLWSSPSQPEQVIPRDRLYPYDTIYLDALYPQVLADSWIVLSSPVYQEVYQVEDVAEAARTGFTLSAKTTMLKLRGENLHSKFNDQVRDTVVYAQSEALEIADAPITEPVQGEKIVLEREVTGLEPGRTLVVSGKRARVRVAGAKPLELYPAGDATGIEVPAGEVLTVARRPVPGADGSLRWWLQDRNGVVGVATAASEALVPEAAADEDITVSEVASIQQVSANQQPTEIVLDAPLEGVYDRWTVTIHANVAAATHGETKEEVLGSGDGARPFQTFELKQGPLTHVSGPSASGGVSTLRMRVNDILWDEARSLYGLAPRERVYITRTADNHRTTVEFGDGQTGARLPSGIENITATYRVGLGAEGMVRAGQLSLLMTRPLGVKGVSNPVPATGAADPEKLDEARRNAPFTVLTLDRIVSLRDFEDFARAYAGIGKTQATWLWQGETRLVHLTIAASERGETDHQVAPTSALARNLRLSMDAARDARQRLEIDSFQSIPFKIEARVLVQKRYISEQVLSSVSHALYEAFSFQRRDFGQPVMQSEVLSVIQRVRGVGAADLDYLYTSTAARTLEGHLSAARAAWADTEDDVLPSQLLTLAPNGLSLTEMPE